MTHAIRWTLTLVAILAVARAAVALEPADLPADAPQDAVMASPTDVVEMAGWAATALSGSGRSRRNLHSWPIWPLAPTPKR